MCDCIYVLKPTANSICSIITFHLIVQGDFTASIQAVESSRTISYETTRCLKPVHVAASIDTTPIYVGSSRLMRKCSWNFRRHAIWGRLWLCG